ncbi:MAG TPA: M4 family metallopeptidase [Anaerolineaceae bacterium]
MQRNTPRLGIFLVMVLLFLSPSRSGTLVSGTLVSGMHASGSQAAKTSVVEAAAVASVAAVPGGPPPLDPEGVQRLEAGGARVTLASSTGGASFITFSPAQSQALALSAVPGQGISQQAAAFWQNNGSVFGVKDAARELVSGAAVTDRLGGHHLTYNQIYRGLPVFGGQLKLHFDARGQIIAANGLFVPGIKVPAQPAFGVDKAAALAVAAVNQSGTQVRKTTLLIYRSGLAQGIPGIDHLAYAVETRNGGSQRSFVYLDALTGEVLDKVDGVETIQRSVYLNQYNPSLPAQNLTWSDASGFPYTGGDSDVQSLIQYAGETYNLYNNLSGGSYRSFDGQDAQMISVAHAIDYLLCPDNAAWTGYTIEVCNGMAVDDVIAHEWSHAYTEYTQNLVYMYQPGALNEAYSDIFGEIVDRLNGLGTDTPDTARTPGVCALDTTKDMELDITAPAGLAQRVTYVGTGLMGPRALNPVSGSLARAIDGVGVIDDACEPLSGAVLAGKVALVQRSGNCTLATQIINAQHAAATAVVLYNAASYGERVGNFYSSAYEPVTIPSVLIGNQMGAALVNAVNAGSASVTLKMYTGVPDTAQGQDSVRWVLGEDATALGGAIRDMWEPTCFGDPGKVSDPQYACNTDSQDNGGVHTNSGVINHTFALLTDGGLYNGQNVTGIGLTKSAAIYWYAERYLQTPLTDFTAHAGALEAACKALTGQPLYTLSVQDGPPQASNERISDADCAQVHATTLATELTSPPGQCNFQPVLAKNPPVLCGGSGQGSLITLFSDNFEPPSTGWTTGRQPGPHSNAFTTPDWAVTDSLPGGRSGKAYYAVNSTAYGDCSATDASGVRMLYSPVITLPDERSPYLAFEHYVATEAGYDGGNLWIQVNGGAWQPVLPVDITYNRYNASLVSTSAGNDDPLAGQFAYTGMDQGKVTGSWGQTQVMLYRYAKAGDTIRLGFYLGQDGCNGVDGWYVDNVRVYTCSEDYPHPTRTYLPVTLH